MKVIYINASSLLNNWVQDYGIPSVNTRENLVKPPRLIIQKTTIKEPKTGREKSWTTKKK